MKSPLVTKKDFRAGRRGMTLAETMVAVAIASLVLTAIGTFWMFGLRSFTAMGNYVNLDARSRNAVDLMNRDLREATQVLSFQNAGTTRWLLVTNSFDNTTSKFTWNTGTRTLVWEKTGRPATTLLTECDNWEFNLFQRTPRKNSGHNFYPATNAMGGWDVTICKSITMNWKCSRTIFGRPVHTESVQTTQVVLRNKP